MEENTLSVLKIAPGQYPQQVEIDKDLKALQQAVGGSIGASYPFADNPVAIVYNDEPGDQFARASAQCGCPCAVWVQHPFGARSRCRQEL